MRRSKNKMKVFLIQVVFLGLLAGASLVVFGHQLPVPLPEPIATLNQRFNPESQEIMSTLSSPEIVKKIPINTQTLGEADAQLKILAEKGEFLSEQAGEVLGEAIKATEGDEPLTEKAFEYGRYLYCQQVVEQWDKDQSN
jgi:hypothetical protein